MKEKDSNNDDQLDPQNNDINTMFTIEKALEALSLLNEEEQKGVIDTIEFNLRKSKILKALYLNNQKD